jgi:hypothetical protein
VTENGACKGEVELTTAASTPSAGGDAIYVGSRHGAGEYAVAYTVSTIAIVLVGIKRFGVLCSEKAVFPPTRRSEMVKWKIASRRRH